MKSNLGNFKIHNQGLFVLLFILFLGVQGSFMVNTSGSYVDRSTNIGGEVDPLEWFRDADNDGYGNPAISVLNEIKPAGYVADNTDCNDNYDYIHPGAPELANAMDDDCDGLIDEGLERYWYYDNDFDGYGTPNHIILSVFQPVGYVDNNLDCNDNNWQVHPGVEEIINGIDDDCDGMIDEGANRWWYYDYDSDGYGNATDAFYTSVRPLFYVDNALDCDDNNAWVNPGAEEETYIGDGIDNNCNGVIDENVPERHWYRDYDQDGWGNASVWVISKTWPGEITETGPEYLLNDMDCDDNNAAINPNAEEILNGIDDNCNAFIDEGYEQYWYQDSDGDGYGNYLILLYQSYQPAGYVDNDLDCNDFNNAINPDGIEVANNLDDNCDGNIDEGLEQWWYQDYDQDGFGNALYYVYWAIPPEGYVLNPDDCDDSNSEVNPDAIEIYNGIDDNCNALIDEGVFPPTSEQPSTSPTVSDPPVSEPTEPTSESESGSASPNLPTPGFSYLILLAAIVSIVPIRRKYSI